jgi:predicted  nucleic acid-binding Zn-ribbon protein
MNPELQPAAIRSRRQVILAAIRHEINRVASEEKRLSDELDAAQKTVNKLEEQLIEWELEKDALQAAFGDIEGTIPPAPNKDETRPS